MKLPSIFKPTTSLALADILFHKDERTDTFLSLDQDDRIDMMRSLTKHVKRDLLFRLPDGDVASLLEAIPPDEATDMLQLLTSHKREKVLQLLSEDMKNSLSTLLEFDPETAAGLMTLDYVEVEATDTVEDAARKFRQHEHHTGRPPVILVKKEDRLAGFLPGHELTFASKRDKVEPFVKHVPSISYAATHDEVVQMFRAHPHGKVVVLNDAGNVLGIIYSDEVLKLIQQQEDSSLYDFAGISQEESVTDPARLKVKNRYRWLIINLGTAFLAAAVVSMFEATISEYVLLAVYMPIVAGMGGNAATQTLAVQVRGIALKQIRLRTAWRTLKSELGAALINGLINGAIVAAIVIVFNHDLMIALILAVAMVINLQVAALFGTLVPLIMKRLGKDPAASATIFITTGTDVLGFLAFLGLATLLLA